jgi:hypothetical protein
MRFEPAERCADTLRQLASRFPADSSEHSAIRLATLALIHSTINNPQAFAEFIANNERELTTEQRQYVEALRQARG